jgi:hypothetical protein
MKYSKPLFMAMDFQQLEMPQALKESIKHGDGLILPNSIIRLQMRILSVLWPARNKTGVLPSDLV